MKKKCLLIIIALASPFSLLADDKQPAPMEVIISFLPPLFFLLILIAVAIKLRRVDGQSSGLLAEKDKQIVQNAEVTGENPTPPQSTSRLIALLTGLTALTIGICLTTFYFYSSFSVKEPSLSNLSTVLYGLGIGVLPYGFNKASAAIRPQTKS